MFEKIAEPLFLLTALPQEGGKKIAAGRRVVNKKSRVVKTNSGAALFFTAPYLF